MKSSLTNLLIDSNAFDTTNFGAHTNYVSPNHLRNQIIDFQNRVGKTRLIDLGRTTDSLAVEISSLNFMPNRDVKKYDDALVRSFFAKQEKTVRRQQLFNAKDTLKQKMLSTTNVATSLRTTEPKQQPYLKTEERPKIFIDQPSETIYSVLHTQKNNMMKHIQAALNGDHLTKIDRERILVKNSADLVVARRHRKNNMPNVPPVAYLHNNIFATKSETNRFQRLSQQLLTLMHKIETEPQLEKEYIEEVAF